MRAPARSRLVISALLLELPTLIGASGATATHPPARGLAPSDKASAREIRLLMLAVNQHREAIGCKPLIWDERLARLAREYSETMATKGFFGHIDPDGNSPFDRMHHAGIQFLAAGENLAVGQTKGIQVYGDWASARRSPAFSRPRAASPFTAGTAMPWPRWRARSSSSAPRPPRIPPPPLLSPTYPFVL